MEGRISPLPALTEYGGRATIALISSLVEYCTARHQQCKKSISKSIINEDNEFLPCDRILDVGLRSSDPIYLKEAQRITGRYCTLSHCWGASKQEASMCNNDERVPLLCRYYQI
ncbi:hypothetical protein BDV96DRAFT_590071 [Lophiotrema nucula]|uniref:Uncharacterized protein n=1 Tax=Lophiotrema nucula TaxID=690887 RepID=A0A6A5YIJ4_9PLEO|nr:hypothetical protein BDV96DRAFT_590071 [Lophiotrema nucula]